LLRGEFPRQHVGHGAVEGDAQARVVFDGLEALGGVAGVVAVGGGFDGLAAPAGLLADLKQLVTGLLGWRGKRRYHFVKGYGAVGYCDEADDYAVNVVAVLHELLMYPHTDIAIAYATVAFFSLYRACIWSILGTWLCRDSFVVVSHRRAGVKAVFRVRCIRGSDRVQDAHVQVLNARSDWFRRGDVNDMFGC
jgi:hypothetical protein